MDISKYTVRQHCTTTLVVNAHMDVIDGFRVTSEARRRPYLCPSLARNYMQIIGQNYHFERYIAVLWKK